MSEITRRRTLTTAALLLLASTGLLGVAGAVRADGEPAQSLHEQALRLAHEDACRRAEAELARGERFYLVLDPERRSLTLKLRGAILREVSIDSVEVGRARRFFIERDAPSPVRGHLHRGGRLTPQRPLLRLPVEIEGSADEETRTIMLPPKPETAIGVPGRFFIRYEGGVALEFRTGGGARTLLGYVADGLSTLLGGPELRLYLVLDRAAAEAFYRSVPAETDLLVL